MAERSKTDWNDNKEPIEVKWYELPIDDKQLERLRDTLPFPRQQLSST